MIRMALFFVVAGMASADTISLSTSATAYEDVNNGQATSTVSATFDLTTAMMPPNGFQPIAGTGPVELVSIGFNAPLGGARCPDTGYYESALCYFYASGSFTLTSGGMTYQQGQYADYNFQGDGAGNSCQLPTSCSGGYFPLGEYTVTLTAYASVSDLLSSLTNGCTPSCPGAFPGVPTADQFASITVEFTNAPEPGSWMLCLTGLAVCGVAIRRRYGQFPQHG